MFKDIVYTAIGASVLVREKVEEEMQKLEAKGKIQTDDAKSFIESIEAKGKEEDEKLKSRAKEMIKEIIDELGLATKEDIAKLKEELK